MAGQLELVLLLDSGCQDPHLGSPAPTLAMLFPWVSAACACLWCHSCHELVGLWGKALSLFFSLLLPPAPNSVFISQHNFHVFYSVPIGIVLATAFDTSSQVGSSVIKH